MIKLVTLGRVKVSITIRFLRERGDLRWRAIECVLVFACIWALCFIPVNLVCNMTRLRKKKMTFCPQVKGVC